MCKSLISVLFFASCASLLAEPELRGTSSELSQYLTGVPRTVVIGGEAEVRAAADQAVVTLKVTTEHRSLQEALRLNLDVRNKLIAFFKARGIPQEHVHGSRFS